VNEVPEIHVQKLLVAIAGNFRGGRIRIDPFVVLIKHDGRWGVFGENAKFFLTFTKRCFRLLAFGNVTEIDDNTFNYMIMHKIGCTDIKCAYIPVLMTNPYFTILGWRVFIVA